MLNFLWSYTSTMSVKETINKLATHPKKGKLLSAQMLNAQRSGANPWIIINGQRIVLRRVTPMEVRH